MKAKIYLPVLLGCLLFSSCQEEKLDGTSIFSTEIPPKNSFDSWLDDNFVDPYNIHLQYKMNSMEVPFSYDMVPPSIEQSKKMALIIKHMFIDSYNEVAGNKSTFMKQNAPRIITLVGDGDAARGTAESGLKVVLYYINDIKFTYEHVSSTYFKTLNHEFQHILNQKIRFPAALEQISDGLYVGSRYNEVSLADALKQGFISSYAKYSVSEDAAETYSFYVVLSKEQWEARLANAGEGAEIINRKLNILKSYMYTSYQVDMDLLRDVNYRRMNEFDLLDLDNLPF